MTGYLMKRALGRLSKYMRSDLRIMPAADEPMTYVLLKHNDRLGYVTKFHDNKVTVEFGNSDNPNSEVFDLDTLKSSDFRVTYRRQGEYWAYKTLVKHLLLHRPFVIASRRFFKSCKTKYLSRRSLKKTELHSTVEQLVIIASDSRSSKPFVDEATLVKMFNPWITSLRGFETFEIMHKDYDSVYTHYKLILEALVESGELEHEGMGYTILPKVYLTFQRLESEMKRHKQIHTVGIAAAIASALAAIASGLAVYPVLARFF